MKKKSKSAGEILRQLREKRGLSQFDLAQMVGMSVSGLASIERLVARRPHVSSLRSVIAALGAVSPVAEEAVAEVARLTGYLPDVLRTPQPAGVEA